MQGIIISLWWKAFNHTLYFVFPAMCVVDWDGYSTCEKPSYVNL